MACIDFPLRHISVRVPWHDAGWAGSVCANPHLNGACAQLKRIAGHKADALEAPLAGRTFEELPREQWPCCVDERAAFMAPFEMEHVKTHALAGTNPDHYGHFAPTPQRYPAFSAGIIPFLWMMKENLGYYRDLYDLDLDEEREPDLGYDTNWVHEAENQTALLSAFRAHLREQESLCLFYAKHVPFVEGTARVLIGAGRIKRICELEEYRQSRNGMRGMVWERPIQHSIRPKGKDGFLMPYYDLMEKGKQDPTLDLERYTAKAPDEHWDEFSYASELVTHDGAIGALLAVDTVLSRMEVELGMPTGWQREWLHTELVRLWKVRGPFPGLGGVLTAFGLSRGIFVAHAVQQKAGENTDPWPQVETMFDKPGAVLPKELHRDLKELAPTWKKLPTERKTYLRLLSRFELSVEQAKALYEEGSRTRRGWAGRDKDIINDPYRIYEISRHDPEGIKLLTIDRGVFPDDAVRLVHPLEEPSRLDSAADLRRVQALCLFALEGAAQSGHSLLPKDELVERIGAFPIQPACPVTGDMLAARAADMAPQIVATQASTGLALQLERYRTIGDLVRKQVLGRMGGQRHKINCDWVGLLNSKFGPSNDPEERRARQEKSAALTELAEARISVLAGPAGAGKTTVLGILCGRPEIADDGVLLLAPTGKARVRMHELAEESGASALTIAQFLHQHGRYDGRSGRYHMSGRPKATGYGTVVVDEASMLTEDMLGALLDALQGVKRLVLVGDPAQLPPIGAGRPFVDIIAKLRPVQYETMFPRVAPSYAELTVERRQVGTDRPDLRLARWFSNTAPSAGEDDIFSAGANEHATIRFVEWDKPEDFQGKLLDVIVQELKLAGPEDVRGFNAKMGAAVSGDYDYFNATRNGNTGSVEAVDKWQILSPLRGMPFGVVHINRSIHEQFREAFLKLATARWRSIPKPMGAERIVYGDKVINLSNHRRDGRRVYPQEGALGYLANGEIGIAVGQWKTRGSPKILKIEFSSQKGFTYDFYGSDFREEGDPAMELAYALTVHKAQGSQFGLVILVLPEGHPIVSRELVYTALTRHEHRVVVMHQGPRTLLKDLASPFRSETARRLTNLLNECRMVEFPQPKRSVFLQEGLVHRTSTGISVRSKSELIIYEALVNAGFKPEYEKALKFGESTRYPDFTIEDEISGKTVYWEHLGMLDRPDYRQSWERKLKWYAANGIRMPEDGGGETGILVTTRESAQAGFDVASVQGIIRKHLQA